MRYAGFWLRFCALVIDFFCLIPVWVAVYFLLALQAVGNLTADGFSVIQVITGIVAPWVYFSAFESGPWQATPGKRLLGLIVTDDVGNKVSFGRATARYFSKTLSSLIFCIGYIVAAFTDRKQALHDLICKTLVLKGLKSEASGHSVPDFRDERAYSGRREPSVNEGGSEQNWVFAGFSDDGHIVRIAFGANDPRLSGSGITVGRDPKAVDFPVSGSSVSRSHARFRTLNRLLIIEDLNSTNGTFINSNMVRGGTQEVIPSHGSLVLGNIELSIGRY